MSGPEKSKTPLADLLQVEELDKNLFRGQNYPATWGRVFGGQIVAQALAAAGRTVSSERILHSMHGYFILPGELDRPVIFEVEPIRDGRSFNTRRVVALQEGKAIFNMSASFQIAEKGLEHQFPMPDVPHFSELISDREWALKQGEKLPRMFRSYLIDRYIEFRPTAFLDPKNPQKTTPNKNIWIRVEEKLPDDPTIQREALAFASDFNLMVTALYPHVGKFDTLQLASLDHAMWFHRDFRADEWLLYAMDSPSASASRGFNRGNFFNEKGELVASVVQEGLMRKRDH